MKKISILIFASILILSAVSLGNGNHTAAAAGSHMNTSPYYSPQEKATKQETATKITWKEGTVTVTANKQQSIEIPDTTAIHSINVTSGAAKYTVELTKEARDISSISLSTATKHLAIYIRYNAGYELIIVNLSTGEYKVLNDIVQSSTPVDSIQSYSWSPNGKKLAFAYENATQSRVAVYNLSYDSFTYIPRETNIIRTVVVLWDKKGERLDFVSEYPSDQFKLFSYSFITKQVKVIHHLNRSELTDLSFLAKYTTPVTTSTGKTQVDSSAAYLTYYTNKNLGFSLELPASWENKYSIEELGNVVSFLHTESNLKTSAQGVVFVVIRYPGKMTKEQVLLGGGGMRKLLFTTDNYTYVLATPTGVEYSDDTEADYLKMSADITWILKTVKKY